MHRFFARSPQQVADALIGKVLEVGTVKATILDVRPQTPRENASWLDRRPLFGAKPVDAYVAPYRGSHLLFLRTGTRDTCVRIDGISVDGKVFRSPGKVCRALGIKSERSGRVRFNGSTVSISWP